MQRKNNMKKIRSVEILLVEDNPGDVVLTKGAFKAAKLANNMHVAEDGEEAMNFLNKVDGYEDAVTPDIILLDLNLPKKDGREVLEEIKNNSKLRRIPVVILTSSQADQDVMKMYDMHANSYIVKPVNLEKFIEIVKAVESFWFSVVVLPNDVTPK